MNRRTVLRGAALSAAGGGEVLARDTATDSATVTVERDAIESSEYGEIGGSGGLSIETQ